MPHRPGHSRYGGSTPGPVGMGSAPPKKKTNPYKQAAESMMSAGIKNLSGSTTSDKKGDEAKKRQKDYRDRNRNNNVDPIVPKPKPKPDEEKKDIRVTIPGQEPERDDRPTSGVTTGIMDKDTTSNISSNNFGLEYDMTLKGADIVPASFSLMDTTPTESVLQNETFKVSMTDYVMDNIPEEYHNTIAASYVLAEAAITGDIELQKDLTDNSKITVKVNNWGENMEVMYNLSMGGN
jgi:hypothetical protein